MMIGIAEHERRVIGERTRMTMEDRARRGLWNGGYIFGYRKDETTEKLVKHPEEAEIVKKHIFDAYERLCSLDKVVQQLHSIGLRYPIQRSASVVNQGKRIEKPFDKQIVRRMLENEVHLGHVVWGGIRTENAHPKIIEPEQFQRVKRQLDQNRRKRTNTRYARGRQYPLRGLVCCSCGCRMTPQGARGRSRTCHYYFCTRQSHQAGKVECSSPRIPAEALEAALIRLLRQISTCRNMREQIVASALAALGEDSQKVQEEAGLVRQRLSAVQSEINNLLGVLAKMGAEAAALVEEGLSRLKAERELLQGRLKELDAIKEPHDTLRELSRKFVESWTDIGELMDEADLSEQMVIVQHFVQSLELKAADATVKTGTFVLRIFPELGPLTGNLLPPNANGPLSGGAGNRAELTENDVVLQFGKKAPRVGLEPTTRRLTAGCSTIELSRIYRLKIVSANDAFSSSPSRETCPRWPLPRFILPTGVQRTRETRPIPNLRQSFWNSA
jgi:site-specific DNA recombinase